MLMLRATIEGRCVPWQRTARYSGRALTPARQRAYQRHARAALLAERPCGWPLDARYAVELIVHEPDRRRRDLDNEAKTVLDAANGAIWADDSAVDSLAVSRRLDRERPRVEVCVVPLLEGETVDCAMTIRSERPRGVGAPGAPIRPMEGQTDAG